jgi:hypothetical protein
MTKAALSRTCLLAAAAALMCLPRLAMATAGDPPSIGAAAAVKGTVTGVLDDQAPHAVRNGDDVLAGERLTTDAGSSMTIRFADASTFEIGPNATIIVNPLDIKPVKGAAVKSVMVESGAFRSMAGTAAANAQTVIGTHLGAFTSSAAVVVGEVTPQRVALFPADGPGNFTYPAGSLAVPAGGAAIAESDSGNAVTIQRIAGDPATTALMGEAMAQLGAATTTAQQKPPLPPRAPTAVGYVEAPVGALATAVGPDGFIDTAGATLAKEETTPETEVAAAEQSPPVAPPLPPLPNFAPPATTGFNPPAITPTPPVVPPLPPPVPASPI